jgi:CO/xanthine dehydrogenase Mo-binding subunit
MDTPAIDVVFLENRYRHGPFGAKGLGELPFDGAAPAIANAVRHLGLDARDLPLTPERVMTLSDERAGVGKEAPCASR